MDPIQFGYMQLYYKLKIQAQGPQGMRWRVPPGPTVRALINSNTRNLRLLLSEYRQWLRENGHWVPTEVNPNDPPPLEVPAEN